MRYLADSIVQSSNQGLQAFPGTGETLYQRLSQYPEVENLFQLAMGEYTRAFPQMLKWEQFSKVNHLLDIGGGDGSNAIRIAEQLDKIEITILERPEICKIAEEKIQKTAYKDRINVIPCDVFDFDWKTDCPADGILFSHFVEIFSLETINALYENAYKLLPDEGQLYVWTMMCDPNESEGLQAAKSSLYFVAAASGQGMAYPAKDHEDIMNNLGFSIVSSEYFEDIDHGLIISKKGKK